ncbi:LOW QUALITY PROTEIN: hypothetical protein KUTeg_001616, partial [Tegillarca granosa]
MHFLTNKAKSCINYYYYLKHISEPNHKFHLKKSYCEIVFFYKTVRTLLQFVFKTTFFSEHLYTGVIYKAIHPTDVLFKIIFDLKNITKLLKKIYFITLIDIKKNVKNQYLRKLIYKNSDVLHKNSASESMCILKKTMWYFVTFVVYVNKLFIVMATFQSYSSFYWEDAKKL